LAVPTLDSGTGHNQALATYQLITEWGVADQIIGMSFDTTASNTGNHKGAAVLLEKMLSRKLLYLACRHHIMELVAEAVFSKLMERSTGFYLLI
jgi:hypothetical protein